MELLRAGLGTPGRSEAGESPLIPPHDNNPADQHTDSSIIRRNPPSDVVMTRQLGRRR